MFSVISQLLCPKAMAWQIIQSRSLSPQEFLEKKKDILETLKKVTNQEIWSEGDRQNFDFDDYSVYKLRYYPLCYFIMDDTDACIVGAIIESKYYGFFCFHFLTDDMRHVNQTTVGAFDMPVPIMISDPVVIYFFTRDDPMNAYLKQCETKTTNLIPYTALKVDFTSPISIENTVEALAKNLPTQTPPKTDIIYLMDTLAPWKQATRRAVYKVLYKGKTCAMKLFVLRGHSDHYQDSQFLHEAKIYEDVQLTNPDAQENILQFFGFGVVQSFNADFNSTFCFKQTSANTKTAIFSCFILTEFVEQTFESILEHDPSTPYFRQLMVSTISSLYLCNMAGLQHNDIKLDNIFVNADFNVKIGDFDLSTYRPTLLGANPFYRYGVCEATGLGSTENPWTDIFKFLMLMALHYTRHLSSSEWDQLLFVQPVHKNKCFSELQRLKLKSGDVIDAWMKNYNLMVLNTSSEKKGTYASLENNNTHQKLVSQLMAPIETILDVLKNEQIVYSV